MTLLAGALSIARLSTTGRCARFSQCFSTLLPLAHSLTADFLRYRQTLYTPRFPKLLGLYTGHHHFSSCRRASSSSFQQDKMEREVRSRSASLSQRDVLFSFFLLEGRRPLNKDTEWLAPVNRKEHPLPLGCRNSISQIQNLRVSYF